MKTMLILGILCLIPLSPVFAYEYYEIYGEYNTIKKDPTVCFVQWNEQELDEYFYKLTEESVNDWSNKLKEHTKNYDAWNIHLREIPEIENYDYCDIFIIFLDEEIQKEHNDEDNYGMISITEKYEKPGIGIYYLEENKIIDQEILLSTIKHELGHAFGLGHYITNQSHLIEQWYDRENIPSIMIESGVMTNITELDLDKMISIYGKDGFEDLPPKLPEWIQNIFKWYGDGNISDQELIDAIEYLMSIGIITTR